MTRSTSPNPANLDEKRKAADAISAAPQIELPDVAELRRELEAIRAREL